jgi:hypothetical protein
MGFKMMEKNFLTIKEYAEKNNKSVQAVYGQIKRKENAKELKGHVLIRKVNNKKIKVLDEEAIKILNEASRITPSVIMQKDSSEELDQLRMDNKNLLIKVAELQDVIIKKSEKIEVLQDNNILLLEQKKKHWWNKN